MDKNVYNPELVNEQTPAKKANSFDFSTVQNVKLTVDYSSFKTYGPVFFSIYHKNPFVGEGEDEHLDESINPIYEDYTNEEGVFNMNIQLPTYAKRLYVVTGNFYVSEYLMEADIRNGVAQAVATKASSTRNRAAITRRAGTQTNDLSNKRYLSYNIDDKGNLIKRIYKDWVTPLGTWDSNSGVPNYLIDKTNLTEEQRDLICTEQEMDELFSAVSQAIDSNKPCNIEYRNHSDLTLEKASGVTITMLGGNTCWNSTLGYYYYMPGDEPKSTTDLNIIMLFPNTQDGKWKRLKANQSFMGNIGLQRGDAVQLMYYPHIAEEGENKLEDATTTFPAGIKIGFILKANGWAMQGEGFGIKNYTDSNRKYNVWGTSTNGLSYCSPEPFGTAYVNEYKIPNEEGLSRSAKFAYNAPNGDQYAIIAFEDACNDEDYDDVIFALKPINAFTPLPKIEENRSVTSGVYAFEDLWPKMGDYDMNDVVVDFKHEKVMSKSSNESKFKIYQENFYLTTYQNYVTLTSGLAMKLMTKVKPSSIVMKKIAAGSNEAVEVEYTVEKDHANTELGIKEGYVYYLTNDVKGEIGSTYILELNYSKGLTSSNDLATVEPFIYRQEADDKQWEVHIPFEAPTGKMNFNYFGKDSDASDYSDPNNLKYYVRDSDYPFAFFLSGITIDSFKNTILRYQNERKEISILYPDFLEWSTSSGIEKTEWYLMKNDQ
jgi:LruC domain-containing protein